VNNYEDTAISEGILPVATITQTIYQPKVFGH